jgi:ligand-binding sensor domain-containing protein/signal transduction histidine kinase
MAPARANTLIRRPVRGRWLVLVLALLPALLGPAPAAALNPDLAVTQYAHRAWLADQTDGSLPQNFVFAILQTRDGYLWIGTQEGLARFDGVRFTVFNTRNTPALRHNDIWKLLEDRDGNLWIGTSGGGLTRYRDGAFTNYGREQGLSSDHVQALWQDAQGALWIGTRGGGLNRFHDGKFTVYTVKDGLSHDTVYALGGDAAGNLWIGTDGGGLNQLRDGKFTAYTTRQGLPHDTVYAIHPDADGSVWVGTGGGLGRLQGERFTTYRMRDGLSNDNVRAIHRDRAGNLWLGTDGGGLNRYSHGRFAAFTSKLGLSSDSVGAIYEDREGSLWVGTDAGGLNRLKDSKFVGFGAPEGLANENARAILEDRDGALWVGTFGGLFRFHEGRFRAFTTKDGLANDVVLSLAQTREGDLWAGTLGGGLSRYRNGRFTRYSKAEGLTNDTVLSLLEDRHGTLWAGTRSGGLHRFENGRFQAFTTADGLTSNDIRYLLESADGGLWIGTRGGGLNRYRDGKFTALTQAQGLSNDLVLSIHEDAAGTLWIGTFGGGLNRYRDGRFTSYTTKEGLLDDVVFQILEDSSGHLWLSSNHGISRIRKHELEEVAAGRATAVRPTSYGLADGMRSNECNGAHQPAGWKTRAGQLWFPTIKGIVAIDPDKIPRNAEPPPVVLEQVLVNGKPVAAAGEIELPPGRQTLEFRYAALSFLAPERVQFRHKLEGFDEDWVENGTRREAHYTNIPPGRYTFRVRASNNDGVWNEAGASQTLYLEPLFWQRRSFYLVYLLALAAAGYAGMRLQRRRVHELQRRERELLHLMSERQQAEDALRAANRSLELRVIDLSRVQAQTSPGGPQVTVRPLPEDSARPEMGRLVHDFKQLLEQLAARERDLQEARDALEREVSDKSRANEDLEQALKQLRIAQAQLVQSEKLASLGALVAGVAHEINTPVGVSVTAASALQDWAQRVQQQQAAAKLTRSELDRFLAVAGESTQILLKNLQRAADLIQSFKQVAVDQSSGERRRFELKAYIEEVLLSLAPKLNRTPHKVVVECPALSVDSFPGALAQILTNFISNSLAHAFRPGQAGLIRVTVTQEGDTVVLRYGDDGVGIPAENLSRIYDPFFTTKRGSGGSGLGMHIVYNLVTQLLGGTITVSSTEGRGTVFEVRFPAELRAAA